jgi:hypothetical protein
MMSFPAQASSFAPSALLYNAKLLPNTSVLANTITTQSGVLNAAGDGLGAVAGLYSAGHSGYAALQDIKHGQFGAAGYDASTLSRAWRAPYRR